MTEQEENQSRWEYAYCRQSHDAHVGRLMSGLLHNLNGVVQTFAMQSDLLAMMFPKADELINQLEARYADTPPVELGALRELLKSRADLTGQALEKVCSGQEILRRLTPLAAFQKSLQAGNYSLNDFVRAIVEFQCGDSFFKHKVVKEINLAENMPCLAGNQAVAYQVIAALIENAVEALLDSEGPPEIKIETRFDDGNCWFEIQDSGSGILAPDLGRIFELFFSTKENRAGLGLYLAKKSIEHADGQINCESKPGVTRFEIVFPCGS